MEQFLTPQGVLNFTEGVIYGSGLIKNTTNMTNCMDILRHEVVIKGEHIFHKTLSLEIFAAIYGFYDIIYHIDPLVRECRYAPADLTEVVTSRFNTFHDGKVMAVNLNENFSKIFDTMRSVADFFISLDRGVGEEAPYNTGFGAGRIIYYITKENETYDVPVDPAAGLEFFWGGF